MVTYNAIGKNVQFNGKSYFGNTSSLTALADNDVWVAGNLQIGSGCVIKTNTWGGSLVTIPSTGFGSYDAGVCSFDLTGGVTENLLTATTQTGGWSFDEFDVGKTVVLTSGSYLYALAFVEEIYDGTRVQLNTCGWTGDFAGVSFVMPDSLISFTSPILKLNSIGAASNWINNSPDHTSEFSTQLRLFSAAAGVTNLRLYTDCFGYANVDTLQIRHVVGTLAAGALQKVIRVVIDDSGCAGGTTTEIDGFKFTRTQGGSTAHVDAIRVGTGFNDAIHIEGSPPINPGYGYTFTAAYAVTDHVNSGGGGNDSFINPAVNTQIFAANGAGILIGSDNTFSVIEYIMSVAASASITPTFQYSTGDGTWATLSVSDPTLGFRNSGKISFTAPAKDTVWKKSNKCDTATGDITSAYYVRIIRTRSSLPTPPTESYFKIYVGASTTDMLIRGDGTIAPPSLADVSAANNSIYYSTTGSALSYKDSGGIVHALY